MLIILFDLMARKTARTWPKWLLAALESTEVIYKQLNIVILWSQRWWETLNVNRANPPFPSDLAQ